MKIMNSMNPKSKSKFLENHLRMFIEYNSYMVHHFSILYWHLDDIDVLNSVLRSSVIDEGKGNTIKSSNGEKIYYELYQYLRLMKSNDIRVWLASTFPSYESRYMSDNIWFRLACIDSYNKKVKEGLLTPSSESLTLMMAKYS